MRRMQDMMASMGRGGDDMMAHVGEGELIVPRSRVTPKLLSAFLEAMRGEDPSRYVAGGRGNSINPETGAPEFFDSWGEGAVSNFDSGMGAGVYGGGYDTGTYSDGGAQQQWGSWGIAPGQNPADPGGVQAFTAAPAAGGDGGGQQQAAAPAPDQGFIGSMMGQMGQQFSLSGLGDRLSAPTGRSPGILGMMPYLGTAVTLGNMLGNAGRAAGWDVTGDWNYEDSQASDEPTPYEPQAAPAPAPPPGQQFMRPDLMDAPGYLGMAPGMTDLQRRAQIATFGAEGMDSMYRSPETRDYYANLLQRALVGDGGQLGDIGEVLPIERRYIEQMYGQQFPDTTAALLAALANS